MSSLSYNQQEKIIDKFNDIIGWLKKNNVTQKEINLVEKSFGIAKKLYSEQQYVSKQHELFFLLDLAKILLQEIGLDFYCVICIFLYEYDREKKKLEAWEVIDKFGIVTMHFLINLKKIHYLSENIINEKNISNEGIKKIVVALADDIRVFLIKSGEILLKLRNLYLLFPHNAYKLVQEAKEIYAPLLHRLGLYTLKTTLEDLCFEATHTKEYQRIIGKLKQREEIGKVFMQRFIQNMGKKLEYYSIFHEIKYRIKSPSSIWKKMQKKRENFEKLYDVFAMRIIFESSKENEYEQCWKIYDLISNYYKTDKNKVKDWVKYPKPNGYSSLHIFLKEPSTKMEIEVQIRSMRMHSIAEKGEAAHWHYKSSNVKSVNDNALKYWINNTRGHLEKSSIDYESIGNFSQILDQDKIYVILENQILKIVDKGINIKDLIAIYSPEKALKYTGALVNGQAVYDEYQLKYGDHIQIITDENFFVKKYRLLISSKQEKNKKEIKKKKEIILQGEKILRKVIKSEKINCTKNFLHQISIFIGSNNIEQLYYLIAQNKVIPLNFIQDFKKIYEKKLIVNTDKHVVFVLNTTQKLWLSKQYLSVDNLPFRFLNCCHPKYKDNIVGLLNKEYVIDIHTTCCKKHNQKQSQIITARWNNNTIKYMQISFSFKKELFYFYQMVEQLKKIYFINLDSFFLHKFHNSSYFSGYFTLPYHIKHFDVIVYFLQKYKVQFTYNFF